MDFHFDNFVPGLRKNLLSISIMEDKEYAIEFKNQHVLIRLKESILEVAQMIGVIEGNLDRLHGELVQALVIGLPRFNIW